ALPLYPFRKDRHWAPPIDALDRHPQAPPERLPELPPLHPLLGSVVNRTSRRAIFETTLATTSPWTDHRVLGKTVFPGTAYLDIAARAYAAMAGQAWSAVSLTDVAFERPLLLAYRKPKTVRVTIEQPRPRSGEQTAQFRIAAADDEAEIYCQGRIAATSD